MVEFSNRAGANTQYELSRANGHLERMATNIAEAFHQKWFENDQYENQRKAYPSIRGAENILKVGIAEFLREEGQLKPGVPGVDDLDLVDELEALRNVKIDGLLTTNYDHLSDIIFPSFPVFVGQSDLLLGQAQFIGEVYKIHGSVDDPTSLVLTASDYENIRTKSPYLVAKLLTIFAEHPIIFAGYSIDDDYIETILIELINAIGKEKTKEISSKFYFIEFDRSSSCLPSIDQRNIVKQDQILPMTVIRTNSYRWIWEALGELERPIPTNFLRQVKEQIFEIVRHPGPSETRQQVHAVPFGEGGPNLKFVYGFGQFTEDQLGQINKMGSWSEGFAGSRLRIEDIIRDVLSVSEHDLPADQVLQVGIPDHIEPQPTDYVPVHKYLYDDKRINQGKFDFDGLPSIIQTLAERDIEPYPQNKKAFRNLYGTRTLSDIKVSEIMGSDRSPQFKLEAIVILLTGSIISDSNLEEARKVFVEMLQNNVLGGNYSSTFRKAIVSYSRAKWSVSDASVGSSSSDDGSEFTSPICKKHF
ncbi:Uncharacterised protein [Corynebacterium renale]|nr:Uncharacterised protein [Corynebacterium renale]STC95581.1 Uncharacterised protein [Corynebacterium renale]